MGATRVRERSRQAARARRPLRTAELAWLLSLSCAVLTVAAMVWLAVPLGHLLLSTHKQPAFLPEFEGEIFRKPAEQARYLMAIVAAVALAAATLALARRPPRPPPRTTRALVVASQCVGVVFVGVCIWVQRTVAPPPIDGVPSAIQPYFSVPTLIVAVVLAAAAALVVANASARARVRRVLSSRRRSVTVVALAVAVGATVIWLLAGVNFEDTIRNANAGTIYNLKGPLDETFAVLDGRSPLVNFTAQYGSLWPYATALVMSVLGTTLGVFTVTMCAITGVAMLAVFTAFRRVAGSALAALGLYLPFLATSFFELEPGLVNRAGPLMVNALFPLRYAGPYILLALVARHLDGASPRRRWLLFLTAGLVVLNNVDFGIPAFGATFAAMLWTGAPLSSRGLLRLLRDAVAGLLAAYALVSIVILPRTGSLPDLGVLFFTARLFAVSGYALLPTRTLGVHIVFYLTYVAAIAVATVRAIGGDRPRALTGLLAWSGIFGLGVGSYFMGRTSPGQEIAMFSAWALALVLVAAATVEQIARDARPRLTIANVAVFLGMGVAICSLAQTPAPWTQIERLQRLAAPLLVTSSALKQTLVHYGAGKPEAIMSVLGHRVAYEAGVVNVSPYLGSLLIVTYQQVDETLHALRASGGRLLVLPLATTYPNFYLAVCNAGFSFLGRVEADFEDAGVGKPTGLTLWSAPVPGVPQRPCPIQ